MDRPGRLIGFAVGNGCILLVLHSDGIQCEIQPSLIFFLFYGMFVPEQGITFQSEGVA